MQRNLVGRVALVTGASKGIGAEIARRLGAQGAAVAVHYATSKAGAESVVADIVAAGGKAIAVQADVAVEADIRRLFEETRRAFGVVDTLVNNAGVYEFVPIEEIAPAHFHRLFNVNVLGMLLTTREAVVQFGEEGGCVINISSVAATAAPATAAVYSATKAAVDAATRSLAKELGARKIRVNAVNPGLVETEGSQAQGLLNGEWRRRTQALTPLGRIGQPSDIAPLVAFLASDEAAWITGETWHIAGGYR